jgi:M6 family metalloprotease-like protein
MSNGTLTLDFDFYGPYTATYPYKYYGQNILGYDMHPASLAGEAVDLAEAAGCNFAQYDNDSNGNVDTVIIIHAGAGEEASGTDPNLIWSHNWTLSDAQSFGDGTGARTYDGKTIDNYTMQPEYIFTPGDSTIGVFCHEFGHALGLMDLYDIDYNTWGAGDWSLMASGSWNGTNGNRPAPLLAWEKSELGWITITDAASGVNTVTDVEDSHTAYKISTGYSYSGGAQYFLIENKRKEADNYWNADLPGQGLLITLIDEYYINSARSSNRINSRYNGITNAHGVTIIEADATSNTITDWHLWKSPYVSNNSGSSTDTFYSGNKTSLTPSTTPNSYRNAYLSPSSVTRVDSGVSITAISAQGDSMTFTYTP